METKFKNRGIKTPYADLEQFCQNYDHQGEYFPFRSFQIQDHRE